jgi:hypothetical protein
MNYNAIKTTGLLLLLSCFLLQEKTAASATPTTMEPTAPGQDGRVSFGCLKVFSATQESQWGEGSYYYLHTGYRIYDSAGTAVKWVENHNTSIDEDPQRVELEPGKYIIWAQSDKNGYVKMSVIIKPGRSTLVDLESGCNSDGHEGCPKNLFVHGIKSVADK